ncbi:MAG TPA: PIN domain-containing protein [Phototrophicaceae bacterium]|nr:PIN domain-containing protein [Phototrophicaceae bacterium]
MTVGIVDSTVIVHLYRREPAALDWYGSQSRQLSVTPITWMEIIYGAGSRSNLARCKTILSQFSMEYLTPADMDWAMQQMENLRLSHGVATNDTLIASVCQRLQVPLYTHNVKHMLVLLPTSLVVKPY